MEVIQPRDRDLGGFHVRRLLPYVTRKLVGPFIFFDHMGPADFAPGQGMDVRPHPHINLATVTYLFDGAIEHRDSLGSDQVIRPGDINWMTAGRGIVHSERTPPDLRRAGSRIEGIQCWVALPRAHEETDPTFFHHAEASLPHLSVDGASVRLLVGSAFGAVSPVHSFSDIVYLDVQLPAGASLRVPAGARELGVYTARGAVTLGDTPVPERALAIGAVGQDLVIANPDVAPARLMVIGGEPLGERREIWWNFVSSSKERIERAKADWAEGRFPTVPGDDREFIPLPRD